MTENQDKSLYHLCDTCGGIMPVDRTVRSIARRGGKNSLIERHKLHTYCTNCRLNTVTIQIITGKADESDE